MQRDRRPISGPILVAALVAALVIPALPAGAQVVSTERVLRVGVLHDAETLNPAFPANGLDREIGTLQFARLTTRSVPDLEVVPDLAQSWRSTENGQAVIYQLRDDLHWSDGQPLTSADVVYTLERAREEAWPAYAGAVEHLRAEALDERRVRVRTSKPDPRLPALEVPILPRHVYEKVGAGEMPGHEATDGVGSGPYVLLENEPGRRRGLVRNEHWWGGEPFVERVDFLVHPDAGTLVDALARNDLDFAAGLPASELDRVSTSRNVTTIAGRTGPVVVLVVDTADGAPALRDVRVRRALDLAVDRALVAHAVSGGLFTPVTELPISLMPPAWPPDEQTGHGTGPRTAASAALEGAGFRDTDDDGVRESAEGEPLRLGLAVPASWPAETRDALAGPLTEAGFGIDVVDEGERADLAVHELALSAEPLTALRAFTCAGDSGTGEDPVAWCDPTYDAAFSRYLASEPAERGALVEQMATTIADEMPVVPLYQHNELQGYRIDRFTEWSRQPRRYGPVLFSGTPLPYTRLEPSPIFSPPGSRRKLMLAAAGGAGLLLVAGLAGFVALRRTGRISRTESS